MKRDPMLSPAIGDVKTIEDFQNDVTTKRITKKALKTQHLTPKDIRTSDVLTRKEIHLTTLVRAALETKAKRSKLDLKRFIERVCIQVANDKDFILLDIQ